jgi:ABC-2 type transport system ATP-binding protein
MDEPVANLDPQARGDFFRLLTKLRTKGVSILISSHVLAELDLYFDSVTIIDGGHTVYENSKEKMREEAKITHYSVKTSNDVLLKEYLRKIAVQYHMKKENKCINVNISNPSDLIKIETFMSQHKISIDTFIREPVTLDALYKKMVIKGSVDTMKKKGKK